MTSFVTDIETIQPGQSRIAELQLLDSMQRLPLHEVKTIADLGVLRMYEPRAAITVEQTVARGIFLILNGTAEQQMHDNDGHDVMLAMLGRGDIFGEGGLFGLRYRRTTVKATTRITVLQIRYGDLQAFSERMPEFFNALRIQFRERLLQTTLARVPLLSTLNPFERLSLTHQLDDRRVDRGTIIMDVGGMSDGLYIIAEGQATVHHQGAAVAVLQPGDLFGEMSLLDGAPHEATIQALTPVHLLMLPRASCEYVLAQRHDIKAGLELLAAQRRSHDRTADHSVTTERLISTGIIRGPLVLARDAALCAPDCHRCVTACGDRFGAPRLSFSGVTFGKLEAADLCRQCQWSAECVESCPVDAFRLDQSGHLVITDKCIGCGACIEACPYDAINQVPVYPPATNPFTWLLQQVGRQQPTMQRANKCDSCYGYANHACVSACPTGALKWLPVETLADTPKHPVIPLTATA